MGFANVNMQIISNMYHTLSQLDSTETPIWADYHAFTNTNHKWIVVFQNEGIAL